MSRVRLIGLITAVCTPFGLDTIINQIRIASTRYYLRQAGGERCRSWLMWAFGGPCWGKELLFSPKSPRKTPYFKFIFPGAPNVVLLFARVPVPVPFIETAPREGGKGLWNIFQYCTGAMSRVRLIGLITAVFTPFGLYTNINTTIHNPVRELNLQLLAQIFKILFLYFLPILPHLVGITKYN